MKLNAPEAIFALLVTLFHVQHLAEIPADLEFFRPVRFADERFFLCFKKCSEKESFFNLIFKITFV